MLFAGPAPTSSIGDFAQRARSLVDFLVERQAAAANMRQCEQDVADWIDGWRRHIGPGAEAQQHFESTELGIILRTLNGPLPTGPRFEECANQQLCWLLARCLAQQA